MAAAGGPPIRRGKRHPVRNVPVHPYGTIENDKKSNRVCLRFDFLGSSDSIGKSCEWTKKIRSQPQTIDSELPLLSFFVASRPSAGFAGRGSGALSSLLAGGLGRRFPGRRALAGGTGRDGADQALGAGADQILPVGGQQGLLDQIIVLGVAVLDQRPLHGLLVGVGGHVDPLHGARVQAGVIHHRGDGRTSFPQKTRQRNQCKSGVWRG